jgi:hypothetical protein
MDEQENARDDELGSGLEEQVELAGPVERDHDNVISLSPGGGVKPKKSPEANGEEYGVNMSLPFGSWTDFSQSGRGQIQAANRQLVPLENLVEMRKKDGQARALLRLLTLPIWRAAADGEWVKPDDKHKQHDESGREVVTQGESDKKTQPEGDDYGVAETEFINQMWNLPPYHGGMTVPWTRLIRQITLALFDGTAPFEIVRYVPDTGPLKGKVILKKLAYRDPRTVKFLIDEKGGYDGFRQVTTANGKAIDVKIPQDKSWYYAANEEENPFYGISWFESAYFHYDVKRKLYYISHIAAQMAAIPARVGKPPERGVQVDPVRQQAVKKALQDMAFNMAMTLPPGWDVDTFNANSGFDFMKLIDHHNLSMAKSVMARFLDDEQRAVLIDNSGNVDANADFFVMALEAIMSEIAESLSHHVIPQFIDYNFGSSVYPTFKFGVLSDSSKDTIKDLFTVIATAQTTQWTPEFIRELEKKLTDRLGLEVDYDEVEKREKEEAEAAEEQQRAEMALYEQQIAGQNPPQPIPPGTGASIEDENLA